MNFSEYVIKAVCDGDISTKLQDVPYSTDMRELITVGDMVEWGKHMEGGN